MHTEMYTRCTILRHVLILDSVINAFASVFVWLRTEEKQEKEESSETVRFVTWDLGGLVL